MHHTVTQILFLLIIATLVGMTARRVRLPYTLALVLAGIGLGFLHIEGLHGIHLTPDLLLAIFLPALLFEAAYHVDFRRFLRDAPVVLFLAVPGVLLTVAVIGFLVTWALQAMGLENFTLGQGFLLASVVAATDPISVLALFRTMGVPKRLYLMVEGESLVNDGVAVVIFLIVAGVLGIETGYPAPEGLVTATDVALYGVKTLLWMGGVGVLVGALVGMVVSVLTRQIDDRLVEVALTVVVAYGSFIAAEHLHASGVLASVTSGVVLGTFGSRFGMSASTRVAVADFWEFMAFFSNSFIFLLIGLELDVPALIAAAGWVMVVFVAVLIGRALTVYPVVALARLLARIDPIPAKWSHVMVWGGLRGSLSMVLIIGLPVDYPARKILLLLVFGVVSVSLLLQGLTMKPFLTRLGLVKGDHAHWGYERARGRALMAGRALRELGRQSEDGALHPAVQNRLGAWYEARRSQSEAEAAELAGETIGLERLQEAALHLLSLEEDALRHAVAEGVISDQAAETLFGDLATRRDILHHGDDAGLDSALERVLGEQGADTPISSGEIS